MIVNNQGLTLSQTLIIPLNPSDKNAIKFLAWLVLFQYFQKVL